MLLGLIAALYAAGVIFFMGHTYPNTRMGTVDVSMKSESQIAQIANSIMANYTVTTTGDGAHFAFSMKDAGVAVNGDQVGRNAVSQEPAWKWPVNLLERSHNVSDALLRDINASGLEQLVRDTVAQFNETGTDPVNASIVYDSALKEFIVDPEKPGTKLNPDKVLEAVDEAVSEMSDTAVLDEDDYEKPALLRDDPVLQTAAATASSYVKADIALVLGTDAVPAGTINADQTSQWVVLGPDYTVTFNEDAMNEWLKDYANGLDTIGTERTYTRPDGAQFTVSGGTYGWEVDTPELVAQVREAIVQGVDTTVTVPCISEGATYPGKGLPEWGMYIDLSLSEQHARCYDTAGQLVWESDVVTGTPDGTHNTPTGVFSILNKQSPAILRGEISVATGQPEYETQVAFWMPFTYQGHGFHDATWQPAFGGARFSQGWGSHGCANLPYDAAASLYDIINIGNAVVVHD